VVEAAAYLGEAVRYLVRINAREVLAARLAWPAGTRPLAPGTRVRVEWDPAALRLVRPSA
jgi:hypothetical protein